MRVSIDMNDQEGARFKYKSKQENLSYRELIKKYIIGKNFEDDINLKDNVRREYLDGKGIKKIMKEESITAYMVVRIIRNILKEYPEALQIHESKMNPKFLELKRKGIEAKLLNKRRIT